MNRKLATLVMVTAFVLAALPAIPATPATAQRNRVYLALGDSLAQGYGATDMSRTAYVPHLYGFFHGDAHTGVDTLVNLGIGGETTSSFMAPGGQLDDALATIATNDIGVVTFNIGSNDMLGLMDEGGPCHDPNNPACIPAAQQAMALFAQNYVQIVGTLHYALSQQGNPLLMVMTYYNPWSGTGSPYEPLVDAMLLGSDGRLDCSNPAGWGMNDLIACLGTEAGADMVANTYPTFAGKALVLTHIGEGNIHPNNAGYAQIASVFEEAYRNR